MLQSMYNGVSAIMANTQAMDVIGNNISNVNTTAYKSSSVSFADQLSNTIQAASGSTATTGGKNAEQLGLGVRVGSVDINNNEGGLSSTSVPSDLAIQGNGYFMVGTASGGTNYTRDGHFAKDNSGNLVSADTGEKVLGYPADVNGNIDTAATISAASTIQIPVGTLTSASATTTTAFTGNLDSGSAAGATTTASVKVYDSLGTAHTVTINLTRNTNSTTNAAEDSWTWTASGDSSLATAAGTTNTGQLTFGSDGQLTSSTGSIVLNTTNGSTTPQTIALTASSMTQLSGTSTFSNQSQDGFPLGTLQSFSVDNNGVVNGVFSNGQSRALAQLAIASVSNPGGMTRAGNNDFAASTDSGTVSVGTANTSGLGSIQAGYLEQSNVDLSTELTNMIVAQRSYQANTKIVTTVDQMLDSLISMKQ